MRLKEAIEDEIASQGISAIDISKASGVSKATIYNILNGLTDDSRIRPSTKRAIAQGCGRELLILDDSGVEFVSPGSTLEAQDEFANASVVLQYLPGRPFLSGHFFQEPFDWLHDLETSSRIPRCDVVNRVFQKNTDFLSLIIENVSDANITASRFSLRVSILKSRIQKNFSLTRINPIPPLGKIEITLFLAEADFDFDLETAQVALHDIDGEPHVPTWGDENTGIYRFRSFPK